MKEWVKDGRKEREESNVDDAQERTTEKYVSELKKRESKVTNVKRL